MALTPEDVVSKRFTTTKFRDGYDQDEVDDFLDEVVEEMRRLTKENEELRSGGSASAPMAEYQPPKD
jgi:DivIVA domain-containing protein